MVKQEIYKINDFSSQLGGGASLFEHVWAHAAVCLKVKEKQTDKKPAVQPQHTAVRSQEAMQKPLHSVCKSFTVIPAPASQIVETGASWEREFDVRACRGNSAFPQIDVPKDGNKLRPINKWFAEIWS